MSTYYTLNATIGYVFTLKDLLEPFTIRTPEVSHMEQKFHKLTKMPLPPQKVTTQKASTTHVINGKSFQKYDLEAVEELVRVLDCNLSYNGELGSDNLEVILSTFPRGKNEDQGRFSFYAFSADTNCSLEPLMPLYKKLKAYGLEPGTPKFVMCCWWS
jgi:hypothetical protein